MNSGIVLKALGQTYNVLPENGQVITCSLKGNLREKDITTTSPVVVGDVIEYEVMPSGDHVISSVKTRRNYIIRQSKKLSKQYQIIAANIDRVFIFATTVQPRTHNTFIDRILVTSEAYGIDAHIILNKIDLCSKNQLKELKERAAIYENIGYPCHVLSLKDKIATVDFMALCKNKVTLLCGLSGTGKTTFVNALIPGVNRKTGAISEYHGTGKHLTTFSEMIPLPGGGFLIDTPGIKEFGIADINKYELSQYFREMNAIRNRCRFNNCLHINEPGCAVMEAVEKGIIALSRYESYLSMYLNEGSEVRYE